MSNIKHVLFDLDGTLTDPFEGITNCLRYALEKLGRPCPTSSELSIYIGPPLRQNFAALLGSDDKSMVEHAVALYRERFSSLGLYENVVYPGVPSMLDELRSDSYNLYVATSKMRLFAEKILEHFRLSSYFAGIFGAEADGRFDNKADLLRDLLQTRSLQATETLMVGDRLHDVAAAKRNGVRAVGVSYGYGSAEELRAAGADVVCESPAAVVRAVRDFSVNVRVERWTNGSNETSGR
ncbi:MAG TPA: HAD hydrolase-like protein [Pyrinomonadaceae bacterium]|nr:HAD hydrolase-like protein [Pyrinomonadaceae bacterium]